VYDIGQYICGNIQTNINGAKWYVLAHSTLYVLLAAIRNFIIAIHDIFSFLYLFISDVGSHPFPAFGHPYIANW